MLAFVTEKMIMYYDVITWKHFPHYWPAVGIDWLLLPGMRSFDVAFEQAVEQIVEFLTFEYDTFCKIDVGVKR